MGLFWMDLDYRFGDREWCWPSLVFLAGCSPVWTFSFSVLLVTFRTRKQDYSNTVVAEKQK